MELISWNIQWGRGADGKVDLARIIDTLRGMADVDVLCLQEITRGFSDLAGHPGPDQVAELSALLPDYQVIFAPGVDRTHRDGSPRQFGNVIATRLPVREIFRHALPWPADPDVASMPRVALEVTVQAGSRLLRIICTHLEYYSTSQRAAQTEALRDWHVQACDHARHPGRSETGRARSHRNPGRARRSCAATSTAGRKMGPICAWRSLWRRHAGLARRMDPYASWATARAHLRTVRQGTMAGATLRL
jgi:endonuclease/exonuclease/phosphatase family metal-dependent hydrolase